MNLNSENLNSGVIESKHGYNHISIEPQYIDYLRSNGYPISDVNELHAVKSSSSDSGHIVVKIQTYDKPETAGDYLDHSIDLWICDCWSYRQSSADVSKPEVKPSDSGTCKHVQSVSKVQRAKSDSNQDTLV